MKQTTFFKKIVLFFCKIYRFLVRNQQKSRTSKRPSTSNPITIPRSGHTISRQAISKNALKVLYRLSQHGHETYLVGGCIRDLLLNQNPKDFDITTSATPEQLRQLFRNCRLIGRRFKLAHILFGKEIIEVATFRGDHISIDDSPHTKYSQHGIILRDNFYGTVEQDARRRDFTINSLYYNINNFTVLDYFNGLKDIERGVIKLIGDPQTRYREDPVRMLRAVRFAAKLNMKIDTKSAQPITQLKGLLRHIPSARLFDESLKLFQSGSGYSTYLIMRQYGLLETVLPVVDKLLSSTTDTLAVTNLEEMIKQVLKNADRRTAENKRVNPAFLFAALLWYPLQQLTLTLMNKNGHTYRQAFTIALNKIIEEQCNCIAIPRRFLTVITTIWYLQLRLSKQFNNCSQTLYTHPKFRAAYNLLQLRASIEKGDLLIQTKWWSQFQQNDEKQR